MQVSRVRMAASGKPSLSAWASFKQTFKSRFMIGDTHEHYIPPKKGFQNRDTQYGADSQDIGEYRFPAPGSQPPANIPRGYPETEYDISFAKRGSYKLSPAPGAEALAEFEQPPVIGASGWKYHPRHTPHAAWIYQPDQIKRMRRYYLETGVVLTGAPVVARGIPAYYPVQKHQTREDWEAVDVIRDIRIPRL